MNFSALTYRSLVCVSAEYAKIYDWIPTHSHKIQTQRKSLKIFILGSGGSCNADGIDCGNENTDDEGLEAIRSLHRQLDDDDNGDIDLSESDDVSSIWLIKFFKI